MSRVKAHDRIPELDVRGMSYCALKMLQSVFGGESVERYIMTREDFNILEARGVFGTTKKDSSDKKYGQKFAVGRYEGRVLLIYCEENQMMEDLTFAQAEANRKTVEIRVQPAERARTKTSDVGELVSA